MDETAALVLGRVVQWLVEALARDLELVGARGGQMLALALRGARVHIRHHEYLKWRSKPFRHDWWDGTWARWGELFGMHRDTFWLSVQTRPTLAGLPLEDGTFAVDASSRLHRVRLGAGDIAVWFGDAVQKATGGRVRAAKHQVLLHRSYRGTIENQGPRRVTMFHIFPESRDPHSLIQHASSPQECEPHWSMWAAVGARAAVLFSSFCLPTSKGGERSSHKEQDLTRGVLR